MSISSQDDNDTENEPPLKNSLFEALAAVGSKSSENDYLDSVSGVESQSADSQDEGDHAPPPPARPNPPLYSRMRNISSTEIEICPDQVYTSLGLFSYVFHSLRTYRLLGIVI